MKNLKIKLHSFAACILLAVLQTQVQAQMAEPVVMSSPDMAVTALDIEAEMQRMTAEQRKVFLGQPSGVYQLASNLLVRRRLAEEAQRNGLGDSDVAKAMLAIARDKVLSDLALQKLDNAQKASPEALDKYAHGNYRLNPKRFEIPEQVQVSHILLGRGAEGKEKAEKLLAEINAGADFASLAKSNSVDFASSGRGGDLGLQTRGNGKFPPAFEAVVFGLKTMGQVSGPIETDIGFHLIKLIDRKPAVQRPYEEVREILVKEAEIQLISEARKRESDRLLKDSVFNPESVEAISARVLK